MAINPDKCIKVTGRFHSTQGTVGDPSLTNIVTGADEVYDDTVPYRYNGHIDCKEVTPVGTENPQELEWFEKVYNTLEPTLFEWVKTTDTSVDSEKTYGVSIGAKQSDVNKQLYERLDDIYEVTINADDVSKVITSDANKIINKEDGYVPTAAAVGEALGANFEDSLASTSTVKGLTANMGRELNEIKANKNGWYEQLVSGASLSLIGDDVDHKATFLERETGDSTATGGVNYSVDKGTATIETIYGHTEKFNQLTFNGNFESASGWGRSQCTFSIENNICAVLASGSDARLIKNSNTNYSEYIQGHKYYFSVEGKVTSVSSNSGFLCILIDSTAESRTFIPAIDTQWHKYSKIVKQTMETGDVYSDNLRIVVDKRASDWDTIYAKNCQIIDLTDIFGAGNEPSTVEEFEAWLANNIGIQDYYDYTPGTLISLNPDSLVSTGFNQWDEEWELGTINIVTGNNNDSNTQIRTKNYNRCFPDTDYYGLLNVESSSTKNAYIIWYDVNYNHCSYSGNPNDYALRHGKVIHSPENAAFFKFYCNEQYGIVYQKDICINISDPAKNGTYMSYMNSTVDLSWIKDIPDPNDSSKKLFPYGLLKAGNVYDEVTATKAIKRIGGVDLGSLTWNVADPSGIFAAAIANRKYGAGIVSVVCSKYSKATTLSIDKTIYPNNSSNQVFVTDSAFANQSADAFKAAMSGVILYYELATPITVYFEEPDTHPMNYEVEDGGREKILPENTSTPTTTSLVADIRYPLNALEAIRNLQNNFSTQGALYQTFNSLCSALNSATTTGTFAVAPDETVIGKFNFTFTPTENTQSVEPNETI